MSNIVFINTIDLPEKQFEKYDIYQYQTFITSYESHNCSLQKITKNIIINI